MLLFLARLQRLDPHLEEAALDLGATPRQTFFRITLPFLMPAALAAAALGFMQSFENYNTTLFSIGIDQTLTIYIAAKVRTALTPAVNALAVIMIALTVIGTVVFELTQRHKAARIASATRRRRAADAAELDAAGPAPAPR
jgi:spermidine/putrescine transport system permease protein